MKRILLISTTNKVKKHIGSHYLLTEIQLWILIFFGNEYIPQEVLNCIKDKSITHNVFGIQDDYSITQRLYCIAFKEHMLAGKTLLNYIFLFFPNDYEKNDKTIYKFIKVNMTSLYFRLKNWWNKILFFRRN